jgi:hypothetical protein
VGNWAELERDILATAPALLEGKPAYRTLGKQYFSETSPQKVRQQHAKYFFKKDKKTFDRAPEAREALNQRLILGKKVRR